MSSKRISLTRRIYRKGWLPTMNEPRVHLPHNVIAKAPGLLPMLYTIRELAEALDTPNSTLRDWLARGAPHRRDARKQIWIVGTEFAVWVASQRKKVRDRQLKDTEAFCVRCSQVVNLVSPTVCHVKGKLYHIKGKCPQCNCTINRGGRYGKVN